MAVFFWHLVKNDLSIVCFLKLVQCTLQNLLFTRYQKHTPMYNWSPCITVVRGSDLSGLQQIFEDFVVDRSRINCMFGLQAKAEKLEKELARTRAMSLTAVSLTESVS